MFYTCGHFVKDSDYDVTATNIHFRSPLQPCFMHIQIATSYRCRRGHLYLTSFFYFTGLLQTLSLVWNARYIVMADYF